MGNARGSETGCEPNHRRGTALMVAARLWITPVAAMVLAAGALMSAPAVSAVQDTWCAPGLGGNWDEPGGRCTLSMVTRANATVDMSLAMPTELLNDPTAGPILQGYALERGRTWRATAEALMRDNVSFVESTVYSHSDTVKTAVLHEDFHTLTTNANNAYRTFTFDLQRHKLLQLNDIFAPGINPLTAIPPLAEPYLVDALAAAPPPHVANVYPFIPDRWQPQPDGSGFSGNYRAFALTPDELILYMPDAPMLHENPPPHNSWQWSMDGGAVTIHIPLAVLRPILAAPYAG
jgi:Protein of unknown function (DUF3298)